MAVRLNWLFEGATGGATTFGGAAQDFYARARTFGWAESWVDVANPIGGQVIINNAIGYARARCLLLPKQTRCVGVRLTDLDTLASRVAPFQQFGTAADTDLPQMCLLLRIQATSAQNHFSWFLKNVPDSLIVNGEYTNGNTGAAAYSQKIVAFLGYLNQNYRFRGKDLTLPKFKVGEIDAGGNVTLDEMGSGFAVNGKVQIYRTQLESSCCGVGGVYMLKSVTSQTQVQLAGWTGGAANGGKISLASDTFTYPIASPPTYNELVARALIRKVGRPFDLFRGRQSPSCCRC